MADSNLLLDDMERTFAKCMAIARKKNHDYAGPDDPIKNFRFFGSYGVVVRLSDKLMRVINFARTKRMEVEDESIKDTLRDIINYAAIALYLMEGEYTQCGPEE